MNLTDRCNRLSIKKRILNICKETNFKSKGSLTIFNSVLRNQLVSTKTVQSARALLLKVDEILISITIESQPVQYIYNAKSGKISAGGY